tara:strand:+ start:1667 stop:1882 length:216 start_codon:yes stop_codon:yes gene_type:complete
MAGKSPVTVVRDILSEPGGFKSLRIRWIRDGKVIKQSIGDLSKKDEKDLKIKGNKKTKKSKALKIKDSETT